jgi:dehypoxanthine futalosine cyclase
MQMRIGAVTYLNAQPLVYALPRLCPKAEVVVDYPSRLADGLAAGKLDVALIPSIEYLAQPGRLIVSDACIAADGPVRSVKLYGRVPPERIRTLALDEGSRTSAALARILLAERFGLSPQLTTLPLGAAPADSPADATVVIGDRGMRPLDGDFAFVWDLGEEWSGLTGLPFVFAMWVAREGVDLGDLAPRLAAARDEGLCAFEQIADAASAAVGLPKAECLSYLRDNLQFHLCPRQRQGLERFFALAAQHALAPSVSRVGRRAPTRSVGRRAPPAVNGGARSARPTLHTILENVLAGERLQPAEGLQLLESHDLAGLGAAADAVTRRLHPEPYRTYNIDRNINYTNVCTNACCFCAFSRPPGDAAGYIIGREEFFFKIEETVRLGGDQILLQGGLHPELGLDWYEQLLWDIKSRFPQINVHGFSPPEIDHLARLSGLSITAVLQRLKGAGLGSLPGGGAEILVDRVRQAIGPRKISAARWLEVCRAWHALGGRGSATMMFGHVETLAERIEHLEAIRRLQDETHGFTAFIPWTFQPDNTRLAHLAKVGAFEYLKTLAVSRLYLDNFANLQASWVTQGLTIGQLALRFGTNDMGSLMIEENVVAAAGTVHHATEDAIRAAITAAGYTPRRRNVFYEFAGSAGDTGWPR